jgi:hypothetical protein
MDAARRERATLTEEESKDAAAILAYEVRYGSFGWDRASEKKLFYMTGRWPDAKAFARLRGYLGVAWETAA